MADYFKVGEKFTLSRLTFVIVVFIVFLIYFFVSLANIIVMFSLEVSGSRQSVDILFIINIIITVLALVLLIWSGYELSKYFRRYRDAQEKYGSETIEGFIEGETEDE